MDIRLIDRAETLDEVPRALAGVRRVALDCEAAGFHRYSDRLCLVQLTAGNQTFVLDPLSVEVAPILGPLLEDPDREIVMHGSDFDLRLLDRDLDIQIRGLFDTQAAATVLGINGIGLQSLLERTLDVTLAKKYQRADWARRPLPQPMIDYAALDTIHLMQLADRLTAELQEAGRMAWAEEEFRALEEIRFEEPEASDPTVRVKASRDLSDREVHRLREALDWRDAVAREMDRAPFRVANDSVLVEVARRNPSSMADLIDLQGLNGRLAQAEGSELLERLRRVDALGDDEVQGLPERDYDGRGRPPPEEEERMRRLKAARNQKASEMGLDRGSLLPNALLEELAAAPPTSLEDIRSVEGIRNWQAEVLGPDLLKALEGAPTGG